MAKLLIDPGNINITTTDDVLDQVRKELEEAGREQFGFWIVGLYNIDGDVESRHSDPDWGHQRLWIPASATVSLCYDRPRSEDPDRLPDELHTVFI